MLAGDVDSVDEIKPGAGAIMSRGLSKIAVYRDPKGEVHERSAVCRHLGCIVKWNTLENTWDCPVMARATTRWAKFFRDQRTVIWLRRKRSETADSRQQIRSQRSEVRSPRQLTLAH